MNAKVGAVLCTLAGHRWRLPDDAETHAGMTVLRCSRCDSESVVSTETFETEGWLERGARRSISDNPYVDPKHADPRFRERRR